MKRSRIVWYILGAFVLFLIVGLGTVWQRGMRPGVEREPFPDWAVGAWWRYESAGAKAITIPDFAGERLIPARTLMRTVVGQITMDNEPLFLITDEYLSGEGQTVQVLFLDPDTLSTYLEEGILHAGFRRQEIVFPVEEHKSWTVIPGWDARVVGREYLDLAGTEVEAYRVDYTKEDEAEWSVWYAPEAKVVVQFDIQGGQFRLADWGQMKPQEAVDAVYDSLEKMSRSAPASTLQALEVLKRHGIGLERNAEVAAKMTSID